MIDVFVWHETFVPDIGQQEAVLEVKLSDEAPPTLDSRIQEKTCMGLNCSVSVQQVYCSVKQEIMVISGL